MNRRDKDKIRLLMNSKEMKDFKAWLLKDMLFDFHFFVWKVGIWKTFPFFTVIRKSK